MENNYLESFQTFAKTAMESAKDLEVINTKVIGQLAAKNMALFNSALELNNQFASLFTETKDTQELLAKQVQLTEAYNGKLTTAVKEAAEIVADSKDDYQAWFEGGLKTVTTATQGIVPTMKTPANKAA